MNKVIQGTKLLNTIINKANFTLESIQSTVYITPCVATLHNKSWTYVGLKFP
jgi:hypothetical protein